jgi:soluble lytic murein transglycosylase-like protein
VDLPPGPGARSVVGTRGNTITVPDVVEIHKKYAGNPIYEAVQSAAERFEVPKDIATRLVYVESRFGNPSANSAGAMGPAQVVGRIHDSAAKKIFGRPVAELTPEENIQYGLGYLRKLYEQHGSWNEAIQRYLGKGAKGDGNLRSSQYASLIE